MDVFKQFQTEDKQLIPKEIYKLNTTSGESTLQRLSSVKDQLKNYSYIEDSDDNRSEQWSDVVSKAEQVVEYPTSFMSLRFLLKDEFSYLTIHLKRLIETKHPLLKTAKSILSTNQQIRGLIVLLLSKAYSVPKHIADNFDVNSDTNNRTAIIHKCQRKLAEITDMIHISQALHRGIVDLPGLQECDDLKERQDLTLGNTISVLIGDYLLAQSSRALAIIGVPDITGLMAKAIGSYSEAEFLRLEPVQRDQDFKQSLENYCYLSGGSLLGQSCRSALLLAQYDNKTQTEAFLIGKYIGTAFQLSHLMSNKSNVDQNSDNFDKSLLELDSNSLQTMLSTNVRKAVQLIDGLDSSEASNALTEIVVNIENVDNFNQIH